VKAQTAIGSFSGSHQGLMAPMMQKRRFNDHMTKRTMYSLDPITNPIGVSIAENIPMISADSKALQTMALPNASGILSSLCANLSPIADER